MFGEEVKQYRKTLKLPQRVLGKSMGVGLHTMCRIEKSHIKRRLHILAFLALKYGLEDEAVTMEKAMGIPGPNYDNAWQGCNTGDKTEMGRWTTP